MEEKFKKEVIKFLEQELRLKASYDANGTICRITIESPATEEDSSPEEVVSKWLHRFGISSSRKGYCQLRRAILMAIEDLSVISKITNVLYPQLAKEFNTTTFAIERNIRTAIEVGWCNVPLVEIDEVFGNTVKSSKGIPTNAAFIATIADAILMERKKF